MNQRYFIYKILSIISLFLIQIPNDKFDISLGLIILISIIDVSRIFDLEFIVSLSFIIGNILLFRLNKRDLIIAYLLIISSLIFFLSNVKFSKTSFFLWIPLCIFLGLSSVIFYNQLIKKD